MPSKRNSQGQKFCYKCQGWKEEDCFWRDKSKPDGLGNRCKYCANAAHRTGNPSGRPTGKAKSAERRDGKKLCYICGDWKPESSFGPLKLALDGLETRCKRCNVIRNNRASSSNTELALGKLAQTHKRHQASYSRRRQELYRKSCVTKGFLIHLWEKQDGLCAITGVEMTHDAGQGFVPTNASVDRIDNEGGYTPKNVRLVCSAVNYIKSELKDDELVWWCQRVVENF